MKQLYLLWNLMRRFLDGTTCARKPIRHSLIAGILIPLLVVESGSAGAGFDGRSAPVLRLSSARETSQAVGKVAVVSGRFAPRLFVDGLDAEAEMISGGTLSEGRFPDSNNDLKVAGEMIVWLPVLFLLLPALPFFIFGAWLTVPTEATEAEVREVNERRLTARKVMVAQGIKMQDDFRERVVTVGRTKTPPAFTVLTDWGPSAAAERPDYRALDQEGFEGVLEVTIEEVCLFSDVNGKSLLFLCMTVNTRLIRTADNAEIYAKSRAYLSDTLTLTEWVGGPDGFRNELDRIYGEIADKIVDDVFSHIRSN